MKIACYFFQIEKRKEERRERIWSRLKGWRGGGGKGEGKGREERERKRKADREIETSQSKKSQKK